MNNFNLKTLVCLLLTAIALTACSSKDTPPLTLTEAFDAEFESDINRFMNYLQSDEPMTLETYEYFFSHHDEMNVHALEVTYCPDEVIGYAWNRDPVSKKCRDLVNRFIETSTFKAAHLEYLRERLNYPKDIEWKLSYQQDYSKGEDTTFPHKVFYVQLGENKLEFIRPGSKKVRKFLGALDLVRINAIPEFDFVHAGIEDEAINHLNDLLDKLTNGHQFKRYDASRYLNHHGTGEFSLARKLVCGEYDWNVDRQYMLRELPSEELKKLEYSEECIKAVNKKMESNEDLLLTQLQEHFELEKRNWKIEKIVMLNIGKEKAQYHKIDVAFTNKENNHKDSMSFYMYEKADNRETFGMIWKLDINGDPYWKYLDTF